MDAMVSAPVTGAAAPAPVAADVAAGRPRHAPGRGGQPVGAAAGHRVHVAGAAACRQVRPAGAAACRRVRLAGAAGHGIQLPTRRALPRALATGVVVAGLPSPNGTGRSPPVVHIPM